MSQFSNLIIVLFLANFRTSHGGLDLQNIEFPPKFQPSSDPNVRAGHLKPFGYQRPPNGPIIEYEEPLRPEKFWESHVSQNQPLVFRGGISESPALSKWTDSYIKEKYGDLDVLIEKKKENRTHGMTSRLLLGDFIDIYQKEDIYVVTVMPDPMREEVQFPQFGSGFSMVDPDTINLDEYPSIPEVEWTYTTINAGDCIYIPSGYIHQVRSYARSISATMLFTASVNNTFEPIGCEHATFEYTPMSKVNVQWTYKKGDRLIEMGFMNIEKFRKLLIDNMIEHGLKRITPEIFKEFIENAFPFDESDEEILQRDPEKMFHTYLDPKGKGHATVEDIRKIPSKDIKMIALNSEAPHGPVKVEYHGNAQQEQEEDDKNVDKNDEQEKDEL
ncbi:hypothetical protein QZH41_014551 [Actinostola sp. cb2023]|nr:hypothetical protein QZH41_014551 [Actinostola sp. cb2023]